MGKSSEMVSLEMMEVDEADGDKMQLFSQAKVMKETPHPLVYNRLLNVDMKLYSNQVLGGMEENIADGDVVSSMKFSEDGNFLGVGDRAGRITLYKRDEFYGGGKGSNNNSSGRFEQYTTFQSHKPEFDYLKSLEIEEKIVQMCWLPKSTQANFILSSNDKTIKLWRIGEKICGTHNEYLNLKDRKAPMAALFMTRRSSRVPPEVRVTANERRCFSNAHSYHINSLSVNSDQETFISADDLRINLWNMEVTDQCFVIVDIKPENLEELHEVITAATFHPRMCNLFAYGSSKGATKLCDMRSAALCDKHAKLFHEPQDLSSRSIFQEVVSSISDVQFSESGRYVATRDYMTVKIWDVVMERRPVNTVPVQGFLSDRMPLMYENDSLYDKFGLSWSGSESKLVTGSYGNLFCVMERGQNLCKSSLFEAVPRDPMTAFGRISSNTAVPLKPRRVVSTRPHQQPRVRREDIPFDNIDFDTKVLFTEWNAKHNVIAVASAGNVVLLSEKR